MKLPSFTVNAATLTVICGLFLQGCGILPAKPRQTVKSLAARINARIEKPRFAAASWGIKIVSLDTGRTLFERNPHKFLMPASNTKLYTSALALETLKPTYQMMTEILATAPLDRRGVLTGDLVLYGLGDPTLGAAADTGAQQSPLDALAAQLAGFGLKRVRGSLIIDDSFFATSPIGSGWQADDLQWGYGAEVSALMLHENVFKLTVQPAAVAGQPCQAVPDTALLEGAATPLINLINRTTTTIPGAATGIGIYRKPGDDTFYLFGSLAIDDAPAKVNLALVAPAEAIGKGLLANLKKYHIMVDGGFHVFHWPAHEMFNIPRQWRGLAGLTSPPLAEIVRQTLKRSQNLYAQDLLLQVGRLASENTEARACAKEGPDCTTEQWGIYALNNFLTQAGISTNSVRLQEGSGLARTNLVTPAATTALLQYVSRRPVAQVFQDALPIAGVDGTLEDRMKGTAAENNARAKTGNLQYVYTLSGYVTTAAKEKLAFSIMLNNYQAPEPDSDNPAAAAPKPTDDIDAIVVMLAEFTGHS